MFLVLCFPSVHWDHLLIPHSIQIHWAGFLKPIRTERTQPLLWRSRQQRRQWASPELMRDRSSPWKPTYGKQHGQILHSRALSKWSPTPSRQLQKTWLLLSGWGVGCKGETTWLWEQPLWTNTDGFNTGLAYVHPPNTGKWRRQWFLVLVLTFPLRQLPCIRQS